MNWLLDHHVWPMRPLGLLFLMASAMLAGGCSSDLETHYGERSGPGASKSINGTSVLGRMFEQAGHRVSSWGMLSPWLMDKADCIVWFPDDFKPPQGQVRRWLEGWLKAKPGRTLIYVGRDYDAQPGYWERVLPDAPEAEQPVIRGRLLDARNHYAEIRKETPESEDADWFKLESNWQKRRAESFEGKPAWTEGLDAKSSEIELRSRLTPSEKAEVLLRAGDDILVSSQTFDDSRLIVAANGSFLLNLPLVNREHRKMAGQLIAEIGPPPQNVVFLESYPGGPPIREKDPVDDAPGPLEVFGIWPMNWILLHLAALGLLFCFARWPIFGLAWEPPAAGISDFGRHVEALGEVLRRSRDRAFARSRIKAYRQMIEREK